MSESNKMNPADAGKTNKRSPSTVSPGSPRGSEVSSTEILKALGGKIPPVKTPFLYRLGLILVAFMMVLLPLIYVGIIFLSGYAVYYHAAENTEILSRGGRGTLILYLAPIVVGIIVIIFMIKPLFARPAKSSKPLELERKEELLLFRFVHKICDAVGAARPRCIRVDCEVNASAGFRRGLRSFLGSDLVLTLGLPLVSGFNLRQLAGVIAHEFGHFSQGTGMRFSYIIRSINAWFARVVYERDEFDEGLIRLSKEWDLRIGVILYLARFMIWLTRRILWVLMWCGHVISSFLLRQMEYDADRYSARLVGSKNYGANFRRLQLLAVSSQAAYDHLQRSWTEKRLADDLPAFILHQLGEIPREIQKRIIQESLQRNTGIFDSHPADRDRIRRIEAEEAPGLFRLELPSTVLFNDYSGLSKEATYSHYRDLLGISVSRRNLVSTENLIRSQAEVREAFRAYRRYFQDCVVESAPIVPGGTVPPREDISGLLNEIRALRKKLEAPFARARVVVNKLLEIEGRMDQLKVLRALKRAHLKFDPAQFELASDTNQTIVSALKKSEAEGTRLTEKLAPFTGLLKRRFDLALGALKSPGGASLLEKCNSSVEEVECLERGLQILQREQETISALEMTCRINHILASNMDGSPEEDSPLVKTIKTGIFKWQEQLSRLDAAFRSQSYPFEHARGKISLARYLVEKLPDPGSDRGIYFQLAPMALERVQEFSMRARGRLAYLAERVEMDLAGLPQLPEPPDDD